MQQQNRPNTSRLVPLSNYDVRELKLENGHQLAMHGLGGLLPKAQSKPTWGRACDTLESVVHQATCNKREPNLIHHGRTPANRSAMVASSGRTWTDDTGQEPGAEGSIRKRTRSNSDNHGNNFSSANTSSIHEEHADPTATCASASAGVRLKNNETTNVITWASFESPPSLKTKGTDDDSACQGGLETQDDGQETTKDGGSGCSRSTKPRRAAAIHNQSERKRRDRINQNLKALQRLVPNASKTDKASMLDEVIIYLEQLQAQVQMMNNLRNMSHMNITNMSSAMQQQHLHQMSVLAHMGMGNPGPTGLAGMEMGMGMEMADMSNMARMAAPRQFLPCIHPTPVVAAAAAPFIPPFMMPPHHPQVKIEPGTNNGSDPFSDPFSALIAQQSMHMDLFNRMTALYRQQVETTAATSGPPQSNHRQGN